MKTIAAALRKHPALLLLVLVYAASCAIVAVNVMQGAGGSPIESHKKVLRFAHWQLEAGIRSAVDKLMADYMQLHPDVEIRQLLIPEEGYFHWVNTQLIGRTAPDMIQCGLGGAVGAALWPKFYARYFLPLDQYVEEPNPYNKGTPLEEVPWSKTYFDDMEGGYEDSLQSYYRVPLSAFTVRLYYNKDLITEVWGPEFPTTYEDFIKLCDALVEYGRKEGRRLVPIAGSGYNFAQFFNAYRTALTADYLDRLDADFNGTVTRVESSSQIYSGATTLSEPAIRANFELVRELSRYFPTGYMSLTRDEAVFLFLQGYSAMISTGSWDYKSLGVQSEFQIGVTQIPLPSKDDPRRGPYVAGPQTEAGITGGFRMAITKTSPNADIALDFLRYASSLKKNEEVNRNMYWLPVIVGAAAREDLKPFEPIIEGYSPTIEYAGPGAELAYDQTLPLYLSGSLDYEKFVEGMMKAYRRELPSGIQTEVRNNEQTLLQQLRFAALRRAANSGAAGVSAVVTGESERQYRRIMEAYVAQLGVRDNDVGVWVQNSQVTSQ